MQSRLSRCFRPAYRSIPAARLVTEGRPGLRVRILHLDHPVVMPGQRVVAGETVLAGTARLLPFRSQIDRFAGHGPHLHIEVHHIP